MYISASVSLLAIDPASFSIDSVSAALVAASGQEASTVSVAVADFPVSTTLSLSGGTALLSSDLSASLAVAVAAEMPTVLGANISVAVGGVPARRRLLDVSVPVNVTGLGSSATAATAVSSALQAPNSLSRMATAAGATGARASAPVVTAQLRVTVSLNPAASTSSHAMALSGLSSPTVLQSALSGAGVQATVAITVAPAIVVATAAPPPKKLLLPLPPPQLVAPSSSPQPPAGPVADGMAAAQQAGGSAGAMMPAVAGAIGAGALCIVAVGWYCRRYARRRAAIPSMKLMVEDEQSADTDGEGVTRARNLLALLWFTRRKGLLRVAAASKGSNEPGAAAAAVAAFDGEPPPPMPPRRHHERHHAAADGVGRRRHDDPPLLPMSSTVAMVQAPSLPVPATEPPPPPPVIAVMALPPPPLPPLLMSSSPPPPSSVPLQTQMRAFVDMAGASCTACGSGLIIVRSNRRDAAGGDGTASIIRCSLFLARAADGQRVCRRRVDERTVIAWYDASVSAGRLPHAAR
jgi:hypothetical protein